MPDESNKTSGLPGFVNRVINRKPVAEIIMTLLALAVWFAVHGDYGITWDETVQICHGEYFFNPQCFVEMSHSERPANARFYEPALPLICAFVTHALHLDPYAVQHGILGLFWVAMFYPACALGRRIVGWGGAWFAGLSLLGTPALLGQAFNNPKDTPLACAVLWLLFVSISVAGHRQLGWRHALYLGGATGFMLAMRPGAWFFGVLPCLVLLNAGWRFYRSHGLFPPPSTFKKPLAILGIAALLAWILMIAPWPDAWHSPLKLPIKAARYAMHFDWEMKVLFHGTSYLSTHLPWNYLSGYLILTTPIPLLLLAVWGHWVLWRRCPRSISATMGTLGLTFVFWFPMLAFILKRPNIYDGLRHFLFLLPPLAVFAGAAAADLVARRSLIPKWVRALVVVVVVLSAVPAMIRLHPYQNIYFNILAGPKDTLSDRYETDYWLSSYREAAFWLNKIQSEQNKALIVAVTADGGSAPALTHFLDGKIKVIPVDLADFSTTNNLPGVDFYVTTVRGHQTVNFPGMPIVHRIERDGVLLSVIKANTGK